MFPLAALLYKRKCQKKKSQPNCAKNAHTATCSPGPIPAAGWLFYLFVLHCPLIQPCLVPLIGWDLYPLSQTWGYVGQVTVLLPPVPWGSLVLLHPGRAWGLFCHAAAVGSHPVRGPAVTPAPNPSPASTNLVKPGTETLDYLFLFWKPVETATSEEGATGVPEAQKYFHLITQPGTVGLIKFLCLCLCSYTRLEMLQLQKALRKSFHLIKTGNIKLWLGS